MVASSIWILGGTQIFFLAAITAVALIFEAVSSSFSKLKRALSILCISLIMDLCIEIGVIFSFSEKGDISTLTSICSFVILPVMTSLAVVYTAFEIWLSLNFEIFNNTDLLQFYKAPIIWINGIPRRILENPWLHQNVKIEILWLHLKMFLCEIGFWLLVFLLFSTFATTPGVLTWLTPVVIGFAFIGVLGICIRLTKHLPDTAQPISNRSEWKAAAEREHLWHSLKYKSSSFNGFVFDGSLLLAYVSFISTV